MSATVTVLVSVVLGTTGRAQGFPTIRVCKEANTRLLTGTFTFDFGINDPSPNFSVQVPVGGCVDVPVLLVGLDDTSIVPIYVTERARPNVAVIDIRTDPPGALSSADLATRTALLDAPEGLTTVVFRNGLVAALSGSAGANVLADAATGPGTPIDDGVADPPEDPFGQPDDVTLDSDTLVARVGSVVSGAASNQVTGDRSVLSGVAGGSQVAGDDSVVSGVAGGSQVAGDDSVVSGAAGSSQVAGRGSVVSGTAGAGRVAGEESVVSGVLGRSVAGRGSVVSGAAG